jgi:hypothetical protein
MLKWLIRPNWTALSKIEPETRENVVNHTYSTSRRVKQRQPAIRVLTHARIQKTPKPCPLPNECPRIRTTRSSLVAFFCSNTATKVVFNITAHQAQFALLADHEKKKKPRETLPDD